MTMTPIEGTMTERTGGISIIAYQKMRDERNAAIRESITHQIEWKRYADFAAELIVENRRLRNHRKALWLSLVILAALWLFWSCA